ncbi:MAG: exonuclease domain-containing protein [Methylocystaceae bacterium]
MDFIIFDLEFNQDPASLQSFDRGSYPYPFEIIQIGAIKLDLNLRTIATFNRYIKPTFYAEINPFITELTGIATEHLMKEQLFPDVYSAFIEFIDGIDSVFCIWGMADIKGLFNNVEYHQLDRRLLPQMVINLQSYISKHFNHSRKCLLGLQTAVELLKIPTVYRFHDAFNDAIYTAEVLRKTYNPSIRPLPYDQCCKAARPKPRKRVLDTGNLIKQFEKMYGRDMTDEEKSIIELAYKMGRTNQFLK